MIYLLIASTGFGQRSASHATAEISSQWEESDKFRSDLQRSAYVGDKTCEPCHQDKNITYQQTSHHLTSALPTQDSILGSFKEPGSILRIEDPAPAIGDPGLTYKMEKRGDRFFQTAITGFVNQLQSRTEQIGIVIGSGMRGQSYLYWRDESLYELPVSYWSDTHQWINSPGYRNGPPNFARPASPRCLECHVSYIKTLSLNPSDNRYDKETFVPGISCETCHGPGSEHVASHQTKASGSQKLSGSRMLNPAAFSRERQIDQCALCHNGAQQASLAPPFSYVPGTPLERHLRPIAVTEDSHPDVHANQVGLLKMSRCFVSSKTMTCSTCHQVHAPERPAASYSPQCLSCHKAESCGMAKKLGPTIKSNCVDCHMPIEQTQAIVSETGDKVIRTTMRTHLIGLYPPVETGRDSK